jgi:hypothetical protein
MQPQVLVVLEDLVERLPLLARDCFSRVVVVDPTLKAPLTLLQPKVWAESVVEVMPAGRPESMEHSTLGVVVVEVPATWAPSPLVVREVLV